MSLDLNTISNRAFRICGLPEVDFNAEDEQAALAMALTEQTVNACLSRQHWSFATRTFKLERDDTQEFRDGRAYAFNLPGDRLSPPLRLLSDPKDIRSIVRDFGLEQRFVYVDEAELWGRFIVKTDPDLWPPIFVEAVVFLLASHYALSAAQKVDLSQEFERKAVGSARENGCGGLMGQALALDPTPSNRQSPFDFDILNSARG